MNFFWQFKNHRWSGLPVKTPYDEVFIPAKKLSFHQPISMYISSIHRVIFGAVSSLFYSTVRWWKGIQSGLKLSWQLGQIIIIKESKKKRRSWNSLSWRKTRKSHSSFKSRVIAYWTEVWISQAARQQQPSNFFVCYYSSTKPLLSFVLKFAMSKPRFWK